jgi:hypothetical protein
MKNKIGSLSPFTLLLLPIAVGAAILFFQSEVSPAVMDAQAGLSIFTFPDRLSLFTLFSF